LSESVLEGVKRLEDMVAGRVKGLTEEEHRQAPKRGCFTTPEFPICSQIPVASAIHS
jgi:hypothetical protein